MEYIVHMVKETSRDLVWIETLESFLGTGTSVTPQTIVDEVGVSERTARDTLKTMAQNGLAEEDRLPDGRVRFVGRDILEIELEE